MKEPKAAAASSPNLERKFIDLVELKSLDEGNGGFEGYANNLGSLDSYADITVKGCFNWGDNLKAFVDEGWSAPDHEWGVKTEIGFISEAREDDQGLWVKVEFHPTADAQDVRAKIKNRIENNKSVKLSIGYSTLEEKIVSGRDAVAYLKNATPEQIALCQSQPRVRLLLKIKLYEVSPVSVGAEPRAGVTAVKGAFSNAVTDAAHKGLFVGFFLSKEAAARLAIEGGEAPEDLHLTICYCGDVSALDDMTIAKAMVAIKNLAEWNAPLTGKASGMGRFNSDNTSSGLDVLYASVDMPGLAELHSWVAYALSGAGIPPRYDHGFDPHITLCYIESSAQVSLTGGQSVPLRFDTMSIVIGSERTDIPLNGYNSSSYSYLGEVQAEVKSQVIIADGLHLLAGSKFAEESETVLAAANGLVTRAKSIQRLRLKEGRTISTSTCERLKAIHEKVTQIRMHAEDMSGQINDLIEMGGQSEKMANPDEMRKLKIEVETLIDGVTA